MKTRAAGYLSAQTIQLVWKLKPVVAANKKMKVERAMIRIS